MSAYFEDYITVAVFAAVGVGLVAVMLGVAAILRPSNPTRTKRLTYECGVDPVGTGAYSYSYGYKWTGYRTVMAYAPGTRILYFSNPHVLYLGNPTGIIETAADSAYNALSLNNTRVTVANWRAGAVVITVSPTTIPAATAGSAYSVTFTQTGGTPPISWSRTGALPSGLSLDAASGVLSGTPLVIGSFPITVTATDLNAFTGSRDYTLVVGCGVVSVTPPTLPSGTIGAAYSQAFSRVGGVGASVWSETGALPSGVLFNTGTAVLSGTPAATGSFPITVSATDVNGCGGSGTPTLVINGPDPFTPTALPVDAISMILDGSNWLRRSSPATPPLCITRMRCDRARSSGRSELIKSTAKPAAANWPISR